ncbi:hypothetical protein PR048_027583 [Dryococelus australis]|uniref:Uncharacterized protein n=1 Tax=Dryococelus australis TaxID=614101 RepID=A0ABQ9GGW8_9NEOP|nr:hypothetical protein PR048_027583 [Dryococelus australis]
MSNTAAVPASEGDSQDYLNGEVCKLGSGPGEVDGNSDDRLGTKGTQKVSECSDVVSDENEDTGVGNTGRNDGEELDKVATEVDKVPPLVQIEEDIDEEKAPGSSGGNSDVIVEETPLSTGTGPRCAGLDNSTYDMHTSIEKEIYELHGVENVNLTPPKDNGAVDSVINLEHTESDKVSTTSNETDLIQILE